MKLKNVHNFLKIEYFLNTLITRAIKVILSKNPFNSNKLPKRFVENDELLSLFLVFKPLKIPKNINKTLIATIDLETIELNNNQIPISISFSYVLNGKIFTVFELIDYNLLLNNPTDAIKLL
jgi:hypothetical protein